MNIEEEIAVIVAVGDGAQGWVPTDADRAIAARIMPLVRRAQAEAGAKALRDAAQEGPKKYYKRDLYGHSGAAIPIEWLDEEADRIEQEAGA